LFNVIMLFADGKQNIERMNQMKQQLNEAQKMKQRPIDPSKSDE